MISIEAKGFSELNKALRELPDRLQAKTLRKALYAGARIARAKAQAEAPVYQGTVKKSTYTRGALTISSSRRYWRRPPGWLRQAIYVRGLARNLRKKYIGYTVDVNLSKVALGKEAWAANKQHIKGSRRWWYHMPLIRGHVIKGPGGKGPGTKVKPSKPYMDLALNTTAGYAIGIVRARLSHELQGVFKNVP